MTRAVLAPWVVLGTVLVGGLAVASCSGGPAGRRRGCAPRVCRSSGSYPMPPFRWTTSASSRPRSTRAVAPCRWTRTTLSGSTIALRGRSSLRVSPARDIAPTATRGATRDSQRTDARSCSARQLAISRFTRTLGTLLAGGIPITRSLDISQHVTNNVILGQSIQAARDSITEGASLAKPLRASGHFPPLVTQLIEVGEQSGELEAMLVKVADSYDEQVETSIQRVTALMEPALILVMVGFVLIIIMATLVPLLEITSSLG